MIKNNPKSSNFPRQILINKENHDTCPLKYLNIIP